MTPYASLPAATRHVVLRDQLPATVGLLKQRRAAEIAEGDIDDYVALHWLEWQGGTLRLTTTGENVCKHQTALQNRAGERARR
ncbi:hypothetical protein ACG02S_11815 [Roseateles sp. DC23W]|uniref:Uncharacterized protein n=1 Tax=Pelomonas dachongensis TaxID=3299029 RepID=A0ABW7EM59_9BURK